MGRRQQDLHATISAIYEAGVDVGRRGEALDRVIDFCHAERAMIGLIEPSGKVHVGDTREVDPEIVRCFVEDYDSRAPFRLEDDANLPAGSVRHLGSLFDQEKVRASPIYGDVLEPGGAVDAIATVLSTTDGFYSFLCVYRGEEAGLFDEASIAAMETLAPHMVRARRIDMLLTAQERRRYVTEGALDQLSTSLVVIDASGHVEFANREAEELLSQEDGIRIVGRELRCDRSDASGRLRTLVEESLASASGADAAAGGVVSIPRALVTPMERRVARSLGVSRHEAPAVLVVLSEPGSADESPERLLRELFDLTTAEARVVWALTRGLSLEEHAEEAGVALSTVRGQLKLAYSKTDTRRQAELVSLVLRSLGPFRS